MKYVYYIKSPNLGESDHAKVLADDHEESRAILVLKDKQGNVVSRFDRPANWWRELNSEPQELEHLDWVEWGLHRELGRGPVLSVRRGAWEENYTLTEEQAEAVSTMNDLADVLRYLRDQNVQS